MMSRRSIFELIYVLLNWLLHGLFDFYEYLVTVYQRRQGRQDNNYLVNIEQQTNKLPSHIAFIVSPNELKFNENLISCVAYLSKHSLCLGIKNITFYDDKGELMKMCYNIDYDEIRY